MNGMHSRNSRGSSRNRQANMSQNNNRKDDKKVPMYDMGDDGADRCGKKADILVRQHFVSSTGPLDEGGCLGRNIDLRKVGLAFDQRPLDRATRAPRLLSYNRPTQIMNGAVTQEDVLHPTCECALDTVTRKSITSHMMRLADVCRAQKRITASENNGDSYCQCPDCDGASDSQSEEIDDKPFKEPVPLDNGDASDASIGMEECIVKARVYYDFYKTQRDAMERERNRQNKKNPYCTNVVDLQDFEDDGDDCVVMVPFKPRTFNMHEYKVMAQADEHCGAPECEKTITREMRERQMAGRGSGGSDGSGSGAPVSYGENTDHGEEEDDE